MGGTGTCCGPNFLHVAVFSEFQQATLKTQVLSRYSGRSTADTKRIDFFFVNNPHVLSHFVGPHRVL